MWTFVLLLQLLWSALVVTWRRLRATTPPRLGWREEVLAETLRRGIDANLDVPIAIGRTRIPPTYEPLSLRRRLHIERHAVVGGRPAEITTPRTWAPGGPVLLYLHGGGYVACSPATHRDLVARLALAAGVRVVSLDYRLAPEFPFPAAVDDAVAALTELGGKGVLFLGGDSAGGGLALATMLRVAREGGALPAAAVLFSPWIDLGPERASKTADMPACFLSARAIDRYVAHYVGSHDPRDPMISPLYGELTALPPTLVQTGAEERLHPEHLALAERARAAGAVLTLRVLPRQVHVVQTLAAVIPEGRVAIEEAGAFLREHLSASRAA